MSERYAAFISYRHLPWDMQVANKVHQMIERYRIPGRLRQDGKPHFGRAFRDREELPLTSDLTADIYKALDDSRFLVVICTPETPKSLWVNREIEYFISKHGRNRVLTVLAAGAVEEAVPKTITHIYDSDGTLLDIREPLAAMIAAPTEKESLRLLEKEFLRLAAAMLGCSYDSLVQRNKQYRQRILSGVLALVAAVALAFAGTVAGKNAEIRSYMAELEYTQSDALAKLSHYTIETGSRAEAISYALQALPSRKAPDRVYLPSAEKALADALQLYEKPHLAQHARFTVNPKTVTVTEDGRYAIFQYSGSPVIECYRMSDGACLWSREIGEYSPYAWILFPDSETVLICHRLMAVQALSLATGEVLRSAQWNGSVLEGNLYPGEKMVVSGGWMNPDDDQVYCDADDTLYAGSGVYFYNDMVNLMKGGTCCAMSVETGQVCLFSVKDGTLLGRVDISHDLALTESGEYVEIWQTGDHEGNLLLATILRDCAGVILRTYTPQGTLVEEQTYMTDTPVGRILGIEVVGPRAMLYGEEGLLLLDLQTKTLRGWTPHADDYSVCMDMQGNLLLFTFEHYWLNPGWLTSDSSLAEVGGRTGQWFVPGDWDGDLNDLPQAFALELPESFGVTTGVLDKGYIFQPSQEEGMGAAVYCMFNMVVPNGRALTDRERSDIAAEIEDRWAQDDPTAFVKDGVEYRVEKVGYEHRVIEAETGETVASYAGVEISDVMLTAYHEETGMLYLYDRLGINKALRIDTENWEVLAEISCMLHFLQESNEVLCLTGQYEQEVYLGYTVDQFEADADGYGYRVYPVYTLDELIALGNEILGNDT